MNPLQDGKQARISDIKALKNKKYQLDWFLFVNVLPTRKERQNVQRRCFEGGREGEHCIVVVDYK